MIRILDIDLDFFLDHRATGISNWKEQRLPDPQYHPWELADVQVFLEQNCGLSAAKKINGKYFVHHVEVFYFLRQLQEQHNYSLKFAIDHIDAHADLGFGDYSYRYISEELLSLPLESRAYPNDTDHHKGLNSGNYLAFLIACRWVFSLRYANRKEWSNDLAWFHFKDFNEKGNIQMKQFSAEQMNQIMLGAYMREAAAALTPLSIEPEVSFEKIDNKKFHSDGNYDWIFLTQSPGYTPKSADALIPLIISYMNEGQVTKY